MANISAQVAGYKPLGAEDAISQAEGRYDVAGSRNRVDRMRGLVGNLQSAV